MAKIEMVMPKMGESVMEGTILTWLKEVGDEIEQDESVLEVATDKVDTEVPATHAGTLVEILVEEGEVVQVGAPIAIIETVGEETADAPSSPAPQQKEEKVEEKELALEAATSNGGSQMNGAVHQQNDFATATRFYSPLVMSIAKEEKISMSELETIEGTGLEGRVTKSDMFTYLKNRQNGNKGGSQQTQAPAPVQAKKETKQQPLTQLQPSKSYGNGIEVVEMDRMRKMIAQRMVESKRTSPHVTSFIEADLTNLVNWRNKWKRVVKERDGVALTFTPIFVEAVAKAIQDFPKINCSVDGDNILMKKAINVGIAVALPNDNLIVPVIHNTNELNLLGITRKVSELVEKARNNKLSPDDLSGGTYTLSNIGSFGNMLGTPIIMQPQVAIMSVGAIVKKPAVVETEQGDMIGIRHMMYLSHSYDHRVVDGALGGKFVRRVADYLENFDVTRTI
ncbi:dihydrolipoamide acetyltransferase family protein [Bernardetia sp.]|uniref:dihydrolipoamide acetyltransferase family protein n=1 Tax=Bernardetia sp. TaxID=1937974 RepID=UPI0025C27718|nr:dihydrolipoamide acetyltransferase family protein [Bernardetia sp.]